MRLTIAVLVFIVAGAYLQPSAAAQGGKSSASHNKSLVKKAYGWFNSNNWDSLATVIAPDYVEHDPNQGQKPGFDGLKAQFAQYTATFPDMKMEPKEIAAEGDMILARVLVTGTMNGKMGDAPPTGKKMEVEMFEQLRLKDGKMVERWGVFDGMKMMTQLGLVPPPGAPQDEKR